MRNRRLPWLLQPSVVLLVLGALVLAGCGNGNGNGLAVGDNAPDFALPDAAGSTVALDDFAGSPALLYFHMADG